MIGTAARAAAGKAAAAVPAVTATIGGAARAAAIKAMEAVPAVTATAAGGAGWAVANKTVAMIGAAVGADMTMMATVAVAGAVTTLEDRGAAVTATATVQALIG
ncbi:MAG: hypothetical protein WBE39_00205, partial [Candidatus Competibacter sp.]